MLSLLYTLVKSAKSHHLLLSFVCILYIVFVCLFKLFFFVFLTFCYHLWWIKMFNSDTVYHHMVDNKSQTFITDTFKYRYETDTLDNNMILLRHRVLYEVNCIIKMMITTLSPMCITQNLSRFFMQIFSHHWNLLIH